MRAPRPPLPVDRKENTLKVLRTFTWRPRPEYGCNCLVCAMFARRQREPKMRAPPPVPRHKQKSFQLRPARQPPPEYVPLSGAVGAMAASEEEGGRRAAGSAHGIPGPWDTRERCIHPSGQASPQEQSSVEQAEEGAWRSLSANAEPQTRLV